MQLSWDEIIQAITDRLREHDVGASVSTTGELDIPYYERSTIESILLECSQQFLREVPFEELESIGSAATITFDSLTSPFTLPTAYIKIGSVSVDVGNTGDYEAVQPVPPAAFIQIQNAPSSYITVWSVFDGALHFTGSRGRMVVLLEPDLATWQGATSPILPDGYDDKRIDWCVKQLRIMNWIPGGTV